MDDDYEYKILYNNVTGCFRICEPEYRWSCSNGVCYQDVNGQFATEEDCKRAGCNRWECEKNSNGVGYKCVQKLGGKYSTREQCVASCGWYCSYSKGYCIHDINKGTSESKAECNEGGCPRYKCHKGDNGNWTCIPDKDGPFLNKAQCENSNCGYWSCQKGTHICIQKEKGNHLTKALCDRNCPLWYCSNNLGTTQFNCIPNHHKGQPTKAECEKGCGWSCINNTSTFSCIHSGSKGSYATEIDCTNYGCPRYNCTKSDNTDNTWSCTEGIEGIYKNKGDCFAKGCGWYNCINNTSCLSSEQGQYSAISECNKAGCPKWACVKSGETGEWSCKTDPKGQYKSKAECLEKGCGWYCNSSIGACETSNTLGIYESNVECNKGCVKANPTEWIMVYDYCLCKSEAKAQYCSNDCGCKYTTYVHGKGESDDFTGIYNLNCIDETGYNIVKSDETDRYHYTFLQFTPHNNVPPGQEKCGHYCTGTSKSDGSISSEFRWSINFNYPSEGNFEIRTNIRDLSHKGCAFNLRVCKGTQTSNCTNIDIQNNHKGGDQYKGSMESPYRIFMEFKGQSCNHKAYL